MYVPRPYRPPDPRWNRELIRNFPLATLISGGAERTFATHLPTISATDLAGAGTGADEGDLVGGQIYGHLNRENPHWDALVSGSPAMLIFQGPNGYVSPTVYETSPAAPTWNFTAVHIHGTLHRIEDSAQTMRIVCVTVRTLEHRLGNNWDMNGSTHYFRTLLPGVGAFVLAIESVDGMFKLSQEQRPEVRRRVSTAFSGSQRGLHRELASMMASLDGPAE